MELFILIWDTQNLLHKFKYRNGKSKEDLHRKLGIFILPIVSDWTNVFIVTWLSYAEEELTYSLALAPDWLTKR